MFQLIQNMNMNTIIYVIWISTIFITYIYIYLYYGGERTANQSRQNIS